METTSSHALRGIVCAVIGGVCWGFSGTCGQYLFSTYGVSSLYVTCVRLLCAGVILTAMALLHNRRECFAIWKKPGDAIHLALYSLGLLLCQYAYMTGISYSNAATTTVLQSLNLVVILLISCLMGRRRPRRREALALVLALLGAYVLATGGRPGQLVLSPGGLFWGLATAGAVVLYTLLPGGLLESWSRETVTGLGMLLGGLTVNLLARSWQFRVSLPWQGMLAMAAIVVLGSVVPFSLLMQAIVDIGPVKASMLATTEPLAATVFSALWLGTVFSPADLAGFAAILATVFLLSKAD